MKKNLLLVINVFIFTVQKAYCMAGAIGSDLEPGLNSPSSNINFSSLVFSLIFVVLLIYVTGLIYQKLNVLGAKTVKEQMKSANLNRVVVLSTTQIGQGRNLHVIELNDKNYLIGSAHNSINLIKELDKNSPKVVHEVLNPEKKEEKEDIDKAIQVLYGNSSKEIKAETEEEFIVHKKYL